MSYHNDCIFLTIIIMILCSEKRWWSWLLMWKRKSNVDDDNVKVINICHFRKIAFGKLEVNHSYPLKNARKNQPPKLSLHSRNLEFSENTEKWWILLGSHPFLDRLNPRVIVPFLAWSLGYEITPRKKKLYIIITQPACAFAPSRPTKKDHDFSSPLTLPPQELQPNRLNPTKITF